MVFNFDVRAIWRSVHVTILATLCIKGLTQSDTSKGNITSLSDRADTAWRLDSRD